MTEYDASEADLEELGERLRRERPVPRAAYRGQLRQNLMREGAPRHRPARLGLLVAACGSSGTLLLVVAALSVAGTGPLAA